MKDVIDVREKQKKAWSPTGKQQKFALLYIDNGVKAARGAGYAGNDNVLAATASRLLRNVNILALIEKRREEEKSALIANRVERQEILSTLAREAEKDKDKISACDQLGKLAGDFVTKIKLEKPHEDWLKLLEDI